MYNFAEVYLCGNISRDPVHRTTSQSTPVTEFYVAVNHKNKETDFFTVVALGELAKFVERKLRKGDTVFIKGSLKQDHWAVGDHKRHKDKITASAIGLDGYRYRDAEIDPEAEDPVEYEDEVFD